MNKYTWMIIALVLAIAAAFLIKDGENQPMFKKVYNYVVTSQEVEVPTEEVMTGTVEEIPADEVVPTEEVMTGTVEEAPADEVMTGTVEEAPADEVVPTEEVPAQ